MKLYFAAAATLLLASSPSFAVSVMSAGQTVQEDCFRAAQTQSPSERQVRLGLSACNAALTGDLSQLTRAGTLVNRGILQAAAGRTDAAIADFNAGLACGARRLGPVLRAIAGATGGVAAERRTHRFARYASGQSASTATKLNPLSRMSAFVNSARVR